MKIIDLNKNELFLINIIREFSFLRYNHGYNIYEIIYGEGKIPALNFMNYANRVKVHVIGNENYLYTVFIKKKSDIFKVSDYYNYFLPDMKSNIYYSLSEQADFIKTYLTPVIQGNMWIDRLLNMNT